NRAGRGPTVMAVPPPDAGRVAAEETAVVAVAVVAAAVAAAGAGAEGMDVFISYSHKDREWKDRVVSFLEGLRRQGYLEYRTWSDEEIRPGQDWPAVIHQAIERAHVAILLLSADFLASEFINETEIVALLDRREAGYLDIVPVVARPCPWQLVKWLAQIQLHPADATPLSGCEPHAIEAHLTDLALEVNRLVGHSSIEVAEAAPDLELERGFKAAGAAPPPANADAASPASYQFLDEGAVMALVAEREGHAALDTLPLFRTRSQRTWLVATRGAVHCVLDSRVTRDGQRQYQWREAVDINTRVRVREQSRSARSGLVDLGRRQNWLYSHRLHGDAVALESSLRQFVDRAARA
ncbi:MAG: toll/interleukin-1 receptor domain-containing protein, partial [Pseudomonadota bacterium]